MVAFFILVTALLILAPLRLWNVVYLMNHYKADEYLSDPRARIHWWFQMIGGFLTLGIIVGLSYCSGIWWVEVAGWLVFVLLGLWIAKKIKMRFDGSYREYYKSIQWQ